MNGYKIIEEKVIHDRSESLLCLLLDLNCFLVSDAYVFTFCYHSLQFYYLIVSNEFLFDYVLKLHQRFHRGIFSEDHIILKVSDSRGNYR